MGVPGVGTRDPRHGLGGPYTRKKYFRTQVQIHTQQPQYGKKFQPPPSKKGYPGAGGEGVTGVKIKKIIGGSFLVLNDDFTRGLTSETIHWGMLRERPPKRGVYDAYTCA